MKRSGPPERRTPLRARTPLEGGQPLKRTGKLPPRSAKRQAIAGERREFVERILRTRPRCEAVDPGVGRCQHRSVDVHEIWPRGRGGPIVPSFGLGDDMVMALCRRHHDWIGDHPAEALRRGWLAKGPPR